LRDLSRLLLLTNGVTGRQGETLLRAAPSAGALYAGEVYVVAERVDGIAPGVYYYAVADHSLKRLREGSFAAELAQALEEPGRVQGAWAAVLLTNVFDRYAWRYSRRGYRYALIDTGHIGENLRLAARSAGLAEHAELRFEDDRLNRLLGVDGRQEAVCGVHLIGTPDRVRAPGSETRRLAETRVVLEEAEEPERYHEATKLAFAPDPHPPGRALPPRPGSSRASVTLGPPARPDASLDEAIRVRRSARQFESDGLTQPELSFVVRAAHGGSGEPGRGGVDLLVVAHRVEGLPAGLYRCEPGADRLLTLQERDFSKRLIEACLGQSKAGRAAAAFLMVGRIEAAAQRWGERSYRDLLVVAGRAGQRIYLAAEAAGLAARNLAAFRDDELNGLVGLDGRAEAVIHLTALGPGD